MPDPSPAGGAAPGEGFFETEIGTFSVGGEGEGGLPDRGTVHSDFLHIAARTVAHL